ncbi:MAG: 50S ribosomal protein L17 [Actinobacteria bacterium]|nr:50S ribosomal protein L17 [Actinomycetota bacterium]MBU4239982.1 50S ribosomal protein L17 [Actinomycetota bacterium]MBU4301180.1 50S ribosomal protein L17 [Actinomycetota bacterium]MBU4385570.1 50S ribosomal protein L17 [Actinomycetota bacterium]MBU4490006.1 50S ribosomal protein L17 [Actinomycetota bacterium]
MPKPKKGPRLGGSASHQKAMLANLAREVITHGRITTTETRAKMAQPVVDRLITYGKAGDVHSRREALKVIGDRNTIHRLFDEVAPRYSDRDGGYTRILKLGPRQGDNAPMVLLEFV